MEVQGVGVVAKDLPFHIGQTLFAEFLQMPHPVMCVYILLVTPRLIRE